MAVTNWVLANGGNWNNVSSWDNGIPTSVLDAVIPAGVLTTGKTITIDAIANMKNFDFSALGVALTFTNAAYAFNIYGDLTENGTYGTWNFTGTGYMYIKGNCTITTNGKTTHTLNRLYIDAVGCTIQQTDDLLLGATPVYFVNGTYNTNNKELATSANFQGSTGTKAFNFGSSIVRVGGFFPGDSPPTMTQTTSSIYCTGILNGYISLYDLYLIPSTSGMFDSYNNSCHNLSITGSAYVNSYVSFVNPVSASGTVTVNGNNSTNYRLLICSYTLGTQRTITAAAVTETNCDYRDIKMAGACLVGGTLPLPADGLRGDCGGNSQITFTTPATLYYKHTSGACNWSDTSKWFTDETPRTTNAGRIPLPQDTLAKLDASSFTGSSTVVIDIPRLPSIDLSGVNKAVVLSVNNQGEYYGHYIMGNSITHLYNDAIYLMGRSNFNLNTYGLTINVLLYINAYGGKYTNLSTLVTSGGVQVSAGTLDLNDFNIISRYLLCTLNTTTYLGNGTVELNNIISVTLFKFWGTLYCEGSTIKLNLASGSIDNLCQGGDNTFNKVWLSGSHTGNFDITGANTIAELIIDAGRKVRFTAGTTQQIVKATIGVGASIDSITAATHTLNYTGSSLVTARGISVKNSIATPANKWWAGASTDLGGNSGWRFAFFKKALNYLAGTRVISAIQTIEVPKVMNPFKSKSVTMI